MTVENEDERELSSIGNSLSPDRRYPSPLAHVVIVSKRASDEFPVVSVAPRPPFSLSSPERKRRRRKRGRSNSSFFRSNSLRNHRPWTEVAEGQRGEEEGNTTAITITLSGLKFGKKGGDFRKSKTGSVLVFKESFRDLLVCLVGAGSFNPFDSYIWFEHYGAPSDRKVDLIGSVIQAWYVMGRLGAFNSSNLQLENSSMDHNPTYDDEKGAKVMPSSFHDISDVEFQDNWGRIWVDLGTCDFLAMDVLLNCLTALNSEYLGIQQVVFGGQCMGDWEEGTVNPDYGYTYFRI
ncbi:uncharacterized protein [Aristolochia californica]|uniref:uncharacterized protein n=1 Tax=Aristolochia californica TaxID=171875 RepID=UPI0035DF149C